MDEFRAYEPAIVEAFQSLEYDADVASPCACSATDVHADAEDSRRRVWRCIDCFNSPICCANKLVEEHGRLPFHRVRRWNGLFFKRSSLGEAGLVLHLGHDGQPCPEAPNDGKTMKLTIGDLTGMHHLDVRRCHCPGIGSSTDDLVPQLVRSRLMPATMKAPRTAFTFRLMEDYELDTLQGKKPQFDFYTKIVRLTRNIDVNADKVSRHPFCRNHVAECFCRKASSRLRRRRGTSRP